MSYDEIVVLVHGYGKSQRDMFTLRKNLESLGHNVVTVNLPLAFKTLKYCNDCFKYEMERILLKSHKFTKIHLVGHSTGGLVIRYFIHNNKINNIGRCVLIATPNKGTELADIADKILRIYVRIFKTLESLKVNKGPVYEGLNSKKIEIGVIAGNKNNLLLGRFLSKENDGRVEVESTKFSSMKDFIVLPYGHKQIHYKIETARLVDNFLKRGSFRASGDRV